MDLEDCVSLAIQRKLKSKHKVNVSEIWECFGNREKGFLEDSREQHKTNPATQWFIAETDFGRKLKIVFIDGETGLSIKTAYEPNDNEIGIYEKHA